jgi:predicted nucleic acid-binding protein
MTTAAGKRVFIDTNVLVYAAVSQSPVHAAARRKILSLRDRGDELWLSRQVLREYLATLSRQQTFAVPQPPSVLVEDILKLQSGFFVAEDGPSVTAMLLEIIAAKGVGGKQIHDANIVATMLTHEIRAILTHNVTDYERFADMIEVLPLS